MKTVSEKFDLFFTWNGEISDTLSKFSEDLPSKIIQTIPTSLRSKKTYPLALDHFELAYFQPVFDKNGLEEPGSWKEFEGVVGTQLFSEMKVDGNQLKGRVYDPESQKTYHGKVTYKEKTDELILRGSLDKAGLLGRSQTWKRKK